MIADDLVVCGAEPLFLTDYIATGKVEPTVVADIVRGVAEGCRQAGMALLGGETAEHPGLMEPGEYDIAGAGTGVVEADRLLGADRVRPGDIVISMASSGLHSNGYSLARYVLLGDAGIKAGLSLDKHVDALGRTLGEEMLEPTRIYSLDCLALADKLNDRLHAFSHITGGGIAANIARVLPENLAADIFRGQWPVPPVFGLIGDIGAVDEADMEKTFNMGIGMVAIIDPASQTETLEFLTTRGIACHAVGVIRSRHDGEKGDAVAKGGKGGAVTVR